MQTITRTLLWMCLLPMTSPVMSETAASEARCSVAVRAGKLLDPGSGALRADQVIRIVGDRIEGVAQRSAEGCARVVDLSGYVVLPGLIDTHTHLTTDATILQLQRLGISVPRGALIGAANARRTLLAGFTTVRDVGPKGFSDVALRRHRSRAPCGHYRRDGYSVG